MQAVQFLGVAYFIILGLLLVHIGHLQSNIGRRKIAGFATIFGLTFIFAAPISLLNNAEGYLIISGLLVVFIASRSLFTNRILRLATLAIFLSVALFASRTDFFIGFDVLNAPALNFLLSALVILTGLTAAWLLLKNVRFSSIRSRLTAAFAAVAVIPLIIAAAAASTIGTKATEDSAIDLLTTVIDLKHAAVMSWLADLKQVVATEAAANQDNISPASLLFESPDTEQYQQKQKILQERLTGSLHQNTDFQEFFIVDRHGNVILSTEENHQGLVIGHETLFNNALEAAFITPMVKMDALGGEALLVVEPVYSDNQLAGFFVGSAALDQLSEIMRQGTEIGETGEIYLVTSDFAVLPSLRGPNGGQNAVQVLTRGVMDAVLAKQDGAGTYKDAQGVEVIGAYRWLPELGAAIFAEQSRAEIFSPTILTIVVNTAISLALIIGAIVFGLIVSNRIGKPIEDLTGITRRVAEGDLNLEAPVSQNIEEMAVLARTFNQMTNQLRIQLENLEQRVAERTQELEARNEQLIIASQLSNTITTILDVDELVEQAVNLIRDRFNLYYVGLFLVDNLNHFAILKSGTGKAGQEMVARSHRIKIGEGMIGWCILNSKARIAQQAVDDPVRLSIPYLPDTQSEAAIPLRSRGQVIGAITVQSDHPNAFDESSITTFQTMADQVAVAIDNARLFVEVQQSLETSRRAYGELSRNAWLKRISARPLQAVCTEQGVNIVELDSLIATPVQDSFQPIEAGGGNGSVQVPIKVRGTVIGNLHAQKPEHSGHWNDEEIEMLETLTDQLGVALESARLFEETLTRAEREQLISRSANRVRETLDVETVLKTAIFEMQAAMDLQEVEVRMAQTIDQENWQ
jgi:GAF domain-containing protein/HAMP domain-containing protein